MQQYADQLVKCVIIGDVEVGKTALMMKMAENIIIKDHIGTIGMDFRVIDVERETGTKFKFQIWDSSGQEKFDTIRRSYLRGYSPLLCYDITKRESFDSIKSKWKREIDKYSSSDPMVLVGLKYDLFDKRQITYDEGYKLAQEYDIPFFETSIFINNSKDEMMRNELCVMGYIRFENESWFNLPEICINTIKKYYYLHGDYENFTEIKNIFMKVGELFINHELPKCQIT